MKFSITILFFAFSLSCFAQSYCETGENESYLGNDSVLCGPREMYTMFENNIFDTLSISCNNVIAIKRFGQKIGKLKAFTENRNDIRLGEISHIVWNFGLLTNIEPEKGGDWSGILIPTNKDIERWEQWFQGHKDHICWYEQKNILFLRKREKTDCFLMERLLLLELHQIGRM